MRNHKIILSALTLQFAALTLAHAQPGLDEEFDDATKQWQEIATRLPAVPTEGDLIPFYVSPTTTFSFAIDANSLTVDSDGVLRYVLVSRSASGAQSISYEGIRCASGEFKLYAFGHPDGSWGRSRRDKWQTIVEQTSNRQHAALSKDFFCENKTISGSAEEILRKMRTRPPSTRAFNSN
jgi:hypothetical protein